MERCEFKDHSKHTGGHVLCCLQSCRAHGFKSLCYSYSHSGNTSTMDTKPALRHPGETSSSPHSEHQGKDLQQIILKSLWILFLNPLSSFLWSCLGSAFLHFKGFLCWQEPSAWYRQIPGAGPCANAPAGTGSWGSSGMEKQPHRWVPSWNSPKGLCVHEGSPAVLQQLWDWEFRVTEAHLPASGFTLAGLGLLTELWERLCSLQNIYWGKGTLWDRKSPMWYSQK